MRFTHLLLALFIAGCVADGPADVRDAIARRASSTTRPAVVAMRPMLGDWITDADATFASSTGLRPDARAALRQDLLANPFELQLTEDGYVSRSSHKVVVDHYDVARVEGEGHVWIALRPRGDEPMRRVELQLGDGRLFLGPEGAPFTYVFRRVGR